MHFSSLSYQKQLPNKSQITTSTPLMRSSSFCVHLIKQCSPILLVHLGCLFEVMGGLFSAERLNSPVKDHAGSYRSFHHPFLKHSPPYPHVPHHRWQTHLASTLTGASEGGKEGRKAPLPGLRSLCAGSCDGA